MMRNLAAGVAQDLDAFAGAFLCSECGLCSVYGCVMNLDPAYMNREMKRRLTAGGVARPKPAERPERVFGMMRRVPTPRLVARLGLTAYDRDAPVRPFTQKLRRLVVPLKQHAGAPAQAVVKSGQGVREGDLLGDIAKDVLGARVHTGMGGIVVEVTADAVTLEVG